MPPRTSRVLAPSSGGSAETSQQRGRQQRRAPGGPADRFVRGGLHDCSSTACALLRPFAPFPWASRTAWAWTAACSRVACRPSAVPAGQLSLFKKNERPKGRHACSGHTRAPPSTAMARSRCLLDGFVPNFSFRLPAGQRAPRRDGRARSRRPASVRISRRDGTGRISELAFPPSPFDLGRDSE